MLIYMSNRLFDLFANQNQQIIWKMLKKKYGANDSGRKKYVTGKWLHVQMVENNSIMKWIHEYENLIIDILNVVINICEILQANVFTIVKPKKP